MTNVTDGPATPSVILPTGRKENNSSQETGISMKRTEKMERLISERWPKLKRKAQHEIDPEKLIPIIEEIDDLLFMLEMRFAYPKAGGIFPNGRTDSNLNRRERLTEDTEIGGP